MTRIYFDCFGDGLEFEKLSLQSTDTGLSDKVTFHKWKSLSELYRYFAQDHFVLLSSPSEDWPKVLTEGMAYGAVPVAKSLAGIAAATHFTAAVIQYDTMLETA
jgi:hypothetical protein